MLIQYYLTWFDFSRASVVQFIPNTKTRRGNRSGFLVYASFRTSSGNWNSDKHIFYAIRNLIYRGSLSWSKSWQLLACHAYFFKFINFICCKGSIYPEVLSQGNWTFFLALFRFITIAAGAIHCWKCILLMIFNPPLCAMYMKDVRQGIHGTRISLVQSTVYTQGTSSDKVVLVVVMVGVTYLPMRHQFPWISPIFFYLLT